MPQHQGMEELLAYFEHTYIRDRWVEYVCICRHNYRSALFPPASWNKREYATEGIARTTNNIWEGWNNSLQSLLICNHPSMWTFFDGIMKETAMQTVSFLHATAGSQRAPKKNTVSSKNVSNVQLTTGRADHLTFLRAIAHLSWF